MPRTYDHLLPIQSLDGVLYSYEQLSGTDVFLTGPMRSEKTLGMIELLRILRNNGQSGGYEVMAFKPDMDTRGFDFLPKDVNANTAYVSNIGEFEEGVVPIDTRDSSGILDHYLEAVTRNPNQIIFIDEIQFFDESILDVVQQLKERGAFVIASGLDYNYRGEFFSTTMESYIARSFEERSTTTIVNLTSLCDYGEPACEQISEVTQRYTNGTPSHFAENPVVLEDGVEQYFPVDRQHLEVPGKDLADRMRNIIVDDQGISVEDLYIELGVEFMSREVKEEYSFEDISVILYRLHQEGAVQIENLETKGLIEDLGVLARSILQRKDGQIVEHGEIITSGRLYYQGIESY